MTKSETEYEINILSQDCVNVFQLDGTAVRGRTVQMGSVLETALNADSGNQRYPESVARLLGEAMMTGALVAKALKFEGRLIVQCHGTNKGAISLLIADCTTDGNIRGYARWDEFALKMIELENRNPGADVLLGGGTFSMTIDQGPDMDQYQGLAAIEGDQLSDCVEHYFKQSEQVPTSIHLACGQVHKPGQSLQWRGGGMMIQRVSGDETRGYTQDAWTTAKTLFGTLTDAELIDPDLSQNDLLFRLFHESGVRIIESSKVSAKCTCSHDRLRQTLESFDNSAREEMAENGIITANCEFCATNYTFDLASF